MQGNGAVGGFNITNGLGWFSIGLGLTEILAPRRLAKMIGAPERPALFRLFGIREVITGIGILSQRRPAGWLWGRVAGDAMDLAVLGSAFASPQARRNRLALATAAVAGVTALDVSCSQKLTRKQRNIRTIKTIIIERSPEDLYQFWRRFENLPQFMTHLKSVERLGENRWHWVVKGPGMDVEWDAQIINEKANELIAWRSLEGADVENAGTVRFERAPGGRGTLVKVEVGYHPPAGKLGDVVAKLFGDAPEQQIGVDLLRFKQLMETGEIARTEGQPAGRTKTTTKYEKMVQA